MMTRLLMLIVVALSLAGCASMYGNMDASQLAQVVKDKNSAAACSKFPTPWGIASVIFVNQDKGAIVNGEVTIAGDCTMHITNETVPHAAPVTTTTTTTTRTLPAVPATTTTPARPSSPAPVPAPEIKSPLSFERTVTGSCVRVERDGNGLVQSVTPADDSQCPK